MTLRIYLKKEIGGICASLDDGDKVLKSISPQLIKNHTVEVDFEGVNLILTPFLNACFGKLLERFGKETIMTHVVMRNISGEFLQRVNNFIDRKR